MVCSVARLDVSFRTAFLISNADYIITQTRPCTMQRFLKAVKMYFKMKNSNGFLIFAQNIDCGYALEPPP